MKVFVTGVGGQLGHDVMNTLFLRGYVVVGSDIQEKYSGVLDGSAVSFAPYKQLDITDREAVLSVIESVHPDVIVHCAAWTAVDAAEDEENRDKVYAVNVTGTKNLVEAANDDRDVVVFGELLNGQYLPDYVSQRVLKYHQTIDMKAEADFSHYDDAVSTEILAEAALAAESAGDQACA